MQTRRSPSRQAGFGPPIDGMLVVAASGIIAAVLIPALLGKSATVTGNMRWIVAGIFLAGFAVSLFIALAIPYGIGLVLAPAQWGGALLGWLAALIAGLPADSRYLSIAIAYAVIPPIAAVVTTSLQGRK